MNSSTIGSAKVATTTATAASAQRGCPISTARTTRPPRTNVQSTTVSAGDGASSQPNHPIISRYQVKLLPIDCRNVALSDKLRGRKTLCSLEKVPTAKTQTAVASVQSPTAIAPNRSVHDCHRTRNPSTQATI